MKKVLLGIALILIIIVGFKLFYNQYKEKEALNKIIKNLEADTPVAEVLVTNLQYDEKTKKYLTTIKFLEYDVHGKPLTPKYFTFTGNIIQFQTLVIRFDDFFVRKNDKLRGKSAYIFWKVFMLDGNNTQEYEINPIYEIPEGYRVDKKLNPWEKKLWAKFWTYALTYKEAKKSGIKNAQIEAPGTMFIPGILYILKIEHDGGMRIDTQSLPNILRGEKIP